MATWDEAAPVWVGLDSSVWVGDVKYRFKGGWINKGQCKACRDVVKVDWL